METTQTTAASITIEIPSIPPGENWAEVITDAWITAARAAGLSVNEVECTNTDYANVAGSVEVAGVVYDIHTEGRIRGHNTHQSDNLSTGEAYAVEAE